MSARKDDVASEFNRGAADQLPETDFCAFLTKKFDRATAAKVIDSFKKMNLPPPQDKEEFLEGTDGCLLLLSRYGLVIRIEFADLENSLWPAERIDSSAWILKPLAAIDAGKAIIEICPGCHSSEQERSNTGYLYDQLRAQNLNFWDEGIFNVGRIPLKTPHFPKGIPIVIDRLAVCALSGRIEPMSQAVKDAAAAAARESAAAQETLYAPLRKAFDAAWPDSKKMEHFFLLCESYLREGKLIAGWHEANVNIPSKASDALECANQYDTRLKSVTAETTSPTFTQWLNKMQGR